MRVGPQLSAAKLGSEQCLPLRGKQPHERVCEANWRRSLCAAKRDPRLRGCTPLRTPIRKSEGAGAKRKQYYFSFLTPPPPPPPLSRVFPRTPAGGRGRPPCQRVTPHSVGRCRGATEGSGPEGLSPLGDWGIPTGLASPPVNGQPLAHCKGAGCRPPLPLSFATHSQQSVGAGHARPATLLCCPSTGWTLPACFAATSPDGEASLAGFARAKGSPHRGAGRAREA